MREDNTPTVSNRTRTPSRKLRLRLETAKALKKANQRSKTVRQRKKEAKANAKDTDPENHVAAARVPRIKKNKLADPPRATSKYKRRQVNKTWLPTHLWHAKRAHMTRPTEPLWRMAIPLSPTEKSYRPSHRAAGSRGCIAWDTSYMPTIGCLGNEHALENMLKAVGFVQEGGSASKHKRWVGGTRFAEGWAYEVDGNKRCVTPMTVIWIQKAEDVSESNGQSTKDAENTPGKKPRKVKLDRRAFIRVHPSAFQQFWTELLKAAKMQKPQVLIEDLRYEIGSIQIAGPGSTEALAGVLKPRHDVQAGSIENVWASLASVGNPASLPVRCLLPFDIEDPRLSHPPKQIAVSTDPETLQHVNELITTWPPDSIKLSVHLASYKHRWAASTMLPSQKAIHRRKATAGKGEAISISDRDPAIPVIVLAQRSGSSSTSAHGSWTVLLPWACTEAIWRSLVHYPQTSGGTPRFGGLNQHRQIAFEQNIPWFPADMPGTEAGKAWERTEAEKRFDDWVRRPPSRRLAWDKLDLGLERKGEVGNGWSCDWEYLFTRTKSAEMKDQTEVDPIVATPADSDNATPPGDPTSKKPRLPLMPGWIRKPRKQKKGIKGIDGDRRRRNTSSPEPEDNDDALSADAVPPVDYYQLTASQAGPTLTKPVNIPSQTPALATVRIRLLTKGHPNPAARIYRLPPPEAALIVPQETSAAGTSQPPTLDPSSHAHSLAPTASVSTSETPSAPGQPSPDPITSSTSIFMTVPSSNGSRSLRDKWLSLVPTESYHSKANLPSFSKQHHNHRSLPSKHTVHAYDPPDHVNVLPKNAPQSIIDEFGPKSLTAEQKEQKEREALMAELMKGDFTPTDAWDASKGLVPCPDEQDLIGFATSGGYNLSEGCGTAIAGVWVQRVAEGWKEDDGRVATESSAMKGKQRDKYMKRHEKQKHFCVVRNAGESVGRLGVWELCE